MNAGHNNTVIDIRLALGLNSSDARFDSQILDLMRSSSSVFYDVFDSLDVDPLNRHHTDICIEDLIRQGTDALLDMGIVEWRGWPFDQKDLSFASWPARLQDPTRVVLRSVSKEYLILFVQKGLLNAE